MCIITNDANEEILENLELLTYKLDIHSFTTNQFKEMIFKKEDNLGN